MKTHSIVLILLLMCYSSYAQQHSLTKIWETDSVFKVPESVLADVKSGVLYVSNIDGKDPWGRDGKGSIGKLGMDGKNITVEWVRGLHSPKGMGLYKGNLYVADLDEVAVIDVSKSEITKKIKVPNAERLNDLTIDPKGVIYVSDSKGNRVYRIRNSEADPYLENLSGPNGVLWFRDHLYVLDRGALLRVEDDRKLTRLAEGMEGGTDGVEAVSDRDFIVSCWAGVIYYVYPDGTKEQLLDTRPVQMNSADIGWNEEQQVIYVPAFWKNRVIAYQLH
ncbi:MAG: SMP-30/gluconolactonase/LRE family protein [Chitinophagaceae bacterium]